MKKLCILSLFSILSVPCLAEQAVRSLGMEISTTTLTTGTTGQYQPIGLNLNGITLIDGSRYTQPISGSITANLSTSTSTLVGVSTVTFAGTAQPVNSTSVNVATVTVSGTSPVLVTNPISTMTIVGQPISVTPTISTFTAVGVSTTIIQGIVAVTPTISTTSIVGTVAVTPTISTVSIVGLPLSVTPTISTTTLVNTSTVTFAGTVQPVAITSGTTSVFVYQNGALWAIPSQNIVAVGTTTFAVQFATVAVSASGFTQVISTTTARKITIMSYKLTANAAVNVKFQSSGGAGTDMEGLTYLGTNGGDVDNCWPLGCFQSSTGEGVGINLSGGVAVGGRITYIAGP